MTLKITAGVFIIIACVLISKFFSQKFRKREMFFSDLSEFCIMLNAEITFKGEDILVILDKLSVRKPFSEMLIEYRHALVSGGKVNFKDFNFLTENEKALIENFFAGLGKYDSGSSYAAVMNMKNTADQTVKTCKDESKKYSSLYTKLGFFLGAAIFIMIL